MLTTTTLILTTALLGGNACADGGADWNQFRGPGGRGTAPDAAPLPAVLDPAKNLVWKCALPAGHSSPAIFGERIFLTSAAAGLLETISIERATGQIAWRRSVEAPAAEHLHPVNSAAAPTPTTDGERVYAYFGSFGLVCYDMAGEELWRREMEVQENTFGTASSPILADGLLILARDTNSASFLEALDPESGETIWRVERAGFKSGWSTPTLWERDGELELIVYGVWWVKAYDLADGSERWAVPGMTDEPIVTPTTGADLVFVSSYNMNTNPEVVGLPDYAALLEELDDDGDGILTFAEADENVSILSRADADGEGDHPLRIFYGFLDTNRDQKISGDEYQRIFDWLGQYEHANALLAIRPGSAETETEIAWQYPHGVPECPSPLYYEGRVYMVKNGGTATCLNARTGELIFQGRLDTRGPCYSSPVAGDGKIYTASARGVVTVFAAGDELRVLSQNDLGERIMATPALLDGKIYIRTDEALYAFGGEE